MVYLLSSLNLIIPRYTLVRQRESLALTHQACKALDTPDETFVISPKGSLERSCERLQLDNSCDLSHAFWSRSPIPCRPQHRLSYVPFSWVGAWGIIQGDKARIGDGTLTLRWMSILRPFLGCQLALFAFWSPEAP